MRSEIRAFLPGLLVHSQNEVYRFNLQDVIIMADSYSALWESKALSTSDLTTVHKITDAYLMYYQQKGRSFHISGTHFVAFCKHFRQASEWGVHNYSRAVMERFGWILKED